MKLLSAILIPLAAVASLEATELGNILSPLASLPANTANPLLHSASEPAAPTVVTSVGGYQLGEAQVLDALQRELTVSLGLRGDLKLQFVEPWTPVEIKNDKDWSIVVDGIPKTGLTANFPVRFSLDVAGKKIGIWQMHVKAQMIEPVWVSTRRLERGESINPAVAALKEVDVLNANKEVLTANDKLDYYEVAHSVAADQVISRADITPRHIVRRGKVVDVVVNDGGINITMKAMALADGGVGETIGVRNMDSKKDFQAQVVGSNTVQVKF
ncbi:MAG: flagellar basal body P-ring formation chaperone FlgA [Spartobacteria bacterium]